MGCYTYMHVLFTFKINLKKGVGLAQRWSSYKHQYTTVQSGQLYHVVQRPSSFLFLFLLFPLHLTCFSLLLVLRLKLDLKHTEVLPLTEKDFTYTVFSVGMEEFLETQFSLPFVTAILTHCFRTILFAPPLAIYLHKFSVYSFRILVSCGHRKYI